MRRALTGLMFLVLLASCTGKSAHPPTVIVAPNPPPEVPVPVASPEETPRIMQIWLSSTSLHPGEEVRGTVTTPTNIASVEVRVESLSMSLHRSTYGRFDVRTHVPKNLPFFLHRKYTLQVIARTTAGQRDRETIPIEVH